VPTLTEQIRFIESVFGSGRLSRNSRNFDVKCPICDPKDPSKKKLSVLLPEGMNHCWACGWRAFTLAPLIRKYGTREQLADYRDRFMPESARNYFNIEDPNASAAQKLTLPSDFRLLATATTSDPDVFAIRRYLLDRGVTDRDLWFYKLGYSNEFIWRRRVMIPSFDASGDLNLYVGRTIDRFRKPKALMPDGDRKHVIFNEINVDWSRRIVLCEGPFDMMKCGDNAIPMLGSDLNEEGALFNMIIANGTPVALAMDADMKATKMPRVAKKLSDYNVDVMIVDVPTDPGDMCKQEFKDALAAARPFEWHRTFLDKLERAARMAL